MSDDLIEIPPFPRKPASGTREGTEWMIGCIDAKLKKLAKLGLRPHPNLVEYRAELVTQLESNGPYALRSCGGWF